MKIRIKKKNIGKLTETMRRTGKSKYELAHSKNPLTRKRALFAINASHWHHKHDEGGYLFQEDGFIYSTPQSDLRKTFGPIKAPDSWYRENMILFISNLEPIKPQPLQSLEGTYGSKYSEMVPMNDGTYINNPINKGLLQDWRTHTLEFTPFLAIGAGPAIGSTTAWLASKPALYNLGRMTLGSEIGGRSVDLASNLFTGNTWGLNVGNVVEGITGLNPNNTMVGLFVTDATNPGYAGKEGLASLAGLFTTFGKNFKDKLSWFYNNGNTFNADAVFRPENFHRHVSQEAIKDARETGVIRGNPLGGRSNNVPFFMKDRGNLFITQDEFTNPSDVIEGTINSADDWVDTWRVSSRRRYLNERPLKIKSILENDEIAKYYGHEGLSKQQIEDLLLEQDFIDDINNHYIRSINDPIVTTDRAKQYISTHEISEFGDEFTPYTNGKFEAPIGKFTYWRKYPFIGWRENNFKDNHKLFDFLREKLGVKTKKR